MSYGYRGNGGVIGYVHSWTATKSGVWDTSVRYANQVPAPPNQPGEYQYTTVGSHTFTVPLGITSICVLVVGGGGGGMYYNNNSTTFSYRMNGGGGGGLTYKNNISCAEGDTFAVVVGAGGSRGAYTYGSTAGGTSSFNTSILATGGNPGRYNQNISGGSGSGGDSNPVSYTHLTLPTNRAV